MSKNNKNKTVFVFIDAANIWEAFKAKGRFLDYKKLVKFLEKTYSTKNIEVFYYSAYPAEGTRDYDLEGKHKFFTFLKKGMEFNVRKKKLKRIRIQTEEGEAIEEKGDMDVEITLDAMHHIEKYDTAVFFTGDSDFLALVSYLRNKAKKVHVYSSESNISNELRTGADGYFDLLKINEDVWGKEIKHRKKKKDKN